MIFCTTNLHQPVGYYRLMVQKKEGSEQKLKAPLLQGIKAFL